MKYIKCSILYILVASFILYVLAHYFHGFGFTLQSDYENDFIIYIFAGVVFWLVNFVLKGILNILTLPISALTFGLFSLVLNFILLYVFEQFINYLDVGVVVVLGNIVQVFALSCLLSLVYLLVKKI